MSCCRDALGRSRCAELIRTRFQEVAEQHFPGTGGEATISTERPVVDNGHTMAFVCSHEITYYCEPTREQLMRWAQR